MSTIMKTSSHQATQKAVVKNNDVFISHFCRVYLSVILQLSKCCGISPFNIVEYGNSQVYRIVFSPTYAFYSCLLALLIPGTILTGLYSNIYNEDELPEDGNKVLNTYVFYMDISPIAVAMFTGIVGLIIRRKSFTELIDHLTQIDKILHLRDAARNKRQMAWFTAGHLLLTFTLLTFSCYLWFDNPTMHPDTIFPYIYYSAFCLAFVFAVTYIQQYFIVNDSVRYRVSILSRCLNTDNLAKTNWQKSNRKMQALKAIVTISDEFKARNISQPLRVLTSEYLSQMLCVYEHLQDALSLISTIYGPTILLIMMAIIISFIISTYFAIVDLMTDANVFVSREITWSMFFFAQLMSIVEASHRLGVRIESIRLQICKLLTRTTEEKLEKQVEVLSEKMLLAPAPFFSPCSMFHVDRTLLTSVISSILTYLVILVNFHRERKESTDE